MPSFRRLACRLARLLSSPGAARLPELWCRPAIVLVLRDQRRAGASVAGWR